MTRHVENALASQFDRYAVREELHREFPHATYEVTVDGRRAVCKVAIGEFTDVGAEAAVYDHVDRTTDVPVPSILAVASEAFVAAWAESLPDPDRVPHPDELPADHARALGATMARLHEATADQFVRPGFPRFDAGGDPTVDPTQDSMDDLTDDPERGRYLTVDDRADWLTLVREFLADHRAHLAAFGWADPADEVLALLDDVPTLFDGAGTPVLCHGNVYPEHVGFESGDGGSGCGGSGDRGSGDGERRDGARCAGESRNGAVGDRSDPDAVASVVDFEHALVAPAEYDFWRTGLPVFHTVDLEPRPQFSAFREGYESVRSLPAGVERRRDGWWLVNTVTYFTSLVLENGGIGPDERDQAEGMADWVDEMVASVRELHR